MHDHKLFSEQHVANVHLIHTGFILTQKLSSFCLVQLFVIIAVRMKMDLLC